MLKQSPFEQQIYEQLNAGDESLLHSDMNLVGPWYFKKEDSPTTHKIIKPTIHQSNSIKTIPKVDNQSTSLVHPKKGRKLSMESRPQHQEFVERQVYDQNRSIQKIITDYFKESDHRKRKINNIGFFVQCYPQRNNKSQQKMNLSGQQFQSSQSYFKKISNKMLNNQPAFEKQRRFNAMKQYTQGYNKQILNQTRPPSTTFQRPRTLYKQSLNPKDTQLSPNSSQIFIKQQSQSAKIPFWKSNNS